jgi:hypothetical protein
MATLAQIRLATEDDVVEALRRAELSITAKPAELLELYNQILDVMGVPDADGDVCAPA